MREFCYKTNFETCILLKCFPFCVTIIVPVRTQHFLAMGILQMLKQRCVRTGQMAEIIFYIAEFITQYLCCVLLSSWLKCNFGSQNVLGNGEPVGSQANVQPTHAVI